MAARPSIDPHVAVTSGQLRLARNLLAIVGGSLVVVVVLAALEPRNNPWVTLAFCLPTSLLVLWAYVSARTSTLRRTGWTLTALFIVGAVIAMIVSGGVTQNAPMAFMIGIVCAGALLGRNPAIAVAVFALVAVTLVAALEYTGRMPPALGPKDSVLNAWSSAVVIVGLSIYTALHAQELLEEALRSARTRATERDAAEAQLVQAQKMDVVGRLVATVAHDFNNLLTVITTSNELMAAESSFDADASEDISVASRRAAMLTQRLLTFGRPRDARPETVDVGGLVRDLAPVLERLAGDGIKLDWDITSDLTVHIDPIAFQQVLLNLVINAKEAVDGRGCIRVGLYRQPDCAMLVVSDDGPGIRPAIEDRIFEPFYTTKTDGTGLGLSTVKRLVRVSNGTIKVERSVDGGAEFVVRWPLGEAVEGAYVDEPTNPSHRRLRALIVEDYDLVRRATVSMLSAAGWEVEAAEDGLQALSFLENHEVDVVISDIAMHGISGEELAVRIRQTFPTLPILLVSGKMPTATMPELCRFVPKPYTREQLLAAIDELMGQLEEHVD